MTAVLHITSLSVVLLLAYITFFFYLTTFLYSTEKLHAVFMRVYMCVHAYDALSECIGPTYVLNFINNVIA